MTAPKRMTERNPHTGEKLQSKMNTDSGVKKYEQNYNEIFGEKCVICRNPISHKSLCSRTNCPPNDISTN